MATQPGIEGTVECGVGLPPRCALARGQSAIEVLGVLIVLITVFWGLGGHDDGALSVLWQAWQARWQRFAATLALPL